MPISGAGRRLMDDQAHGLRVLAKTARSAGELEDTVLVSPRKAARTIAITSGKGGVGKTNFTTNLALLLAQTGQRIIVLDADLGLANLHVVLGVAPKFHLEHVIRGEKTLKEILYPAANGIQIIAGGTGIAELANLTNERRERFIDGLAELDSMADVILIDTGAGLSHNVLGFLFASDEVIVITTPEPTAIADAYATIKVVSRDNPDARIRLVVNMANSDMEAHAGGARCRRETPTGEQAVPRCRDRGPWAYPQRPGDTQGGQSAEAPGAGQPQRPGDKSNLPNSRQTRIHHCVPPGGH
jgi:flagellar biosynthesis protein FlhG